MSEQSGIEVQQAVPAPVEAMAVSEPVSEPAEQPRVTGSESSQVGATCPMCGTGLAVTTSAYGSTSPGACPSCYPSTTASEDSSVRTTGS